MSDKNDTPTEKAAEAAAAAATQAAPDTPGEFETIELETPIRRGEQTISSIQLRKPKAGELRGLQLQSLIQGDTISMISLTPRISIPTLLPHEVEQLGPADIGAIAGTVMGFFMSRKDRAELARVLGMQPPSQT